MPLVSSTGHGALYKFSVGDADMPVIINFVTRQAELNWEDEVYAVARDQAGVIQSMVISKPTRRKIMAKFTGFIVDGVDPSALPANFNFLGRFYISRSLSDPVEKGAFGDIILNAESHPAVTALAGP